jgi:hypothetical protein
MAKKDQASTVAARVLTDCELGAVNDVIEVDPAIAVARPGLLDTNADSVAYALTLPQNIKAGA